MSCLTRKTSETIVIGSPATVTLLEIERGKVRLGVIAPKDVEIWRGELVENGKNIPRPEQVNAERVPSVLTALTELLDVIERDELIPESASYMRRARVAVANARQARREEAMRPVGG